MSFIHDTIRIESRLDVLESGKICTNDKGDILVDDGTKTSVMGVGSNGDGLIANSAATNGMEWRALVASDISNFDTEIGNHTDVDNNTTHVAASSGVHGISGLVVGTTDIQIIANKTFTDNVTYFANNTDSTKKVQLQLSGITTATTRTLTVPDTNTTIVGTTSVQTLSNKTLTTPKINDTSLDHTYTVVVSELTDNRNVTLPLLTTNDTFVFQAHTQNLTNKTLNADLNTITNIKNTDIKSGASIDITKLADGSVSNTEFQYLDGLTSSAVGISTIQTLKNKTLEDASTFFVDNSDSTKKIQFQLSDLTTSTTRTLTVPNADTTIVGTNATQTITNKSINSDNNTITNITNTDIKSGAAIDAVKIADGSVSNTEFQRLSAIGSAVVGVSDTQVLTNKTLTDSTTYFQDDSDNTKKVLFDLSGVTISTTRTLTIPDANTTIVGTNAIQTITNKTFNADNNTVSNIDDGNIKAAAAIDASKIANGTVSNTEFQRLATIGSTAVGISDTQTLTNKTLTDNTTFFQDDGDNTKKMQFQLSGITTSSTRTITIPDENTTLVGTCATQTLTNKTWGDNLNMGSNKITNISEPTAAQDAATKNYVDASSQGLDAKSAVRAKTNEALPIYTKAGTGVESTLTATATGAFPTIDGVTLVADDRILIDSTGTTSDVHNGIYTLTQVGDGSNPWILTRATDSDTDAEVNAGMYVFVTEGDICADSGYILTTNDPITVDTSALTFTQFSGAGQVIGGDGLTKTDNTLDIGGSTTIIANANDIEVNSSATANQILLSSGSVGTAATFGALPLASSNAVSGILAFANGGTNASSFSAGNKIITTNSGNTGLETTLLSASDIATLNGVQTVTNKTFTDSTTYFQDETDTSKKLKFQLSSISTATTRTLTIPDTNTTIVGIDNVQTLTNKIINADNNTISNIDNGDIKTGAEIDATKLANGSVSNTEFQYIGTVTSNVQTQLNAKIPFSETNLIDIENSSAGSADHVQFIVTKAHGGTDDYSLGIDSDPVKIIMSTEDGTYRQANVFSSNSASATATIFGIASSSNSGTNWYPRLAVRQNGTVGIGTSTPSELLDVQGNIALTGTVDGRDVAADGTAQDSHIAASTAHGVSGTIVGTTDAQILTNKTLTDASTYFQDDDDTSKKLQFQLSAITTSTTRTVTIPDANFTMVGTTTTQTITNKSIDADNNTITNIDNADIKSGAAIDATKIADGSISNTEFQKLNGISSAIVGISDTQVITNKTFTDSSTYFQDNLDTSKKLQFQLSGISTSTTRTITVPDADTTLVGLTLNQTLTNKSINSDNNTITNIINADIKATAAISATKIANGTVSNTEFQQLASIGSKAVGISDTNTLTNKTLTSPKIETSINDSNGNELMKVTATGSAVNEITITNAAIGNGPTISATGGDANVNLNVTPKGIGNVVLDNHKWPNVDGSANQVLQTDGVGNLSFVDVSTLDVNEITTTTNATTTILTFSTANDKAYLVEFDVIGLRTDSGSEAAGFVLRALFRNNGGTLTKVGDDKFYARDDKNWDANTVVSGTDIVAQVEGENSKIINWKATCKVTSV